MNKRCFLETIEVDSPFYLARDGAFTSQVDSNK